MSFCNFWHSGALALRSERQSTRMSKIKNGALESFKQQQFGTAGVGRDNRPYRCLSSVFGLFFSSVTRGNSTLGHLSKPVFLDLCQAYPPKEAANVDWYWLHIDLYFYRTTLGRSSVSPTCLAGEHSALPTPTVCWCRRSDCLSAAEPFWSLHLVLATICQILLHLLSHYTLSGASSRPTPLSGYLFRTPL